MKAIVRTKYGSPDILELKEVDKPVPKDNQVLVKIHAASVNPLDWHILRGKPFLVRLMGFGFLKPKQQILGADIAGRVEAVGKKCNSVSRWVTRSLARAWVDLQNTGAIAKTNWC